MGSAARPDRPLRHVQLQRREVGRPHQGREVADDDVVEGLAVGPDLTRASAVVIRLRRDGTPVGSSPRASDAEGERAQRGEDGENDGGQRPDLPRSPESDDPWQVTASELDSPAGDHVARHFPRKQVKVIDPGLAPPAPRAAD